MNTFDIDLFVIGAGSGGVRAARIAASLGATVAIAEDKYLGGTCVNVGCVPKKLFVYGSHFSEDFDTAKSYGWNLTQADFDWKKLLENKNTEIERLNGIYDNLLRSAGVQLYRGHAKILDPHRLLINDKEITAKHILVATGGWPFVPEFEGSDLVITSNEAFYLDKLPKRIAVVGGGYIAAEFAGIFNGLGVETYLIYRGPLFLRGFDEDVRNHMVDALKQKGVHLLFDTDVEKVIQRDKELVLSLSSGKELVVGEAMYATGRIPYTDNLGLENTQVKLTDSGHIKVDKDFQTDEPSIYAVGDVTGGIELTPVAIAEGSALAKSLFAEKTSVDYHFIPTAVFSQPNISTVGYTETEARKNIKKIRIYETRFRHMKHSLGSSPEKTYMKLIVDDSSDKVVGCHMVGQDAGEIIQGVAVAMKAGATKSHFDDTVGIHPTAAEELVTLREVTRT
jgi:glutathione reductase (NADPH)